MGPSFLRGGHPTQSSCSVSWGHAVHAQFLGIGRFSFVPSLGGKFAEELVEKVGGGRRRVRSVMSCMDSFSLKEVCAVWVLPLQ